MTVVTSKEVCKAITIVDGEKVSFLDRDPSCKFMPQISYGCYLERADKKIIQFNTLPNTPNAREECGTSGETTAERTADTKLTKASICECPPNTTMTDAITTRMVVANTSDIGHSTSRGTAIPHGNVTQNTTDVMNQTSTTQIFVSASSRCPKDTVVVSNQKECELAQHSIDSLSATKTIKYAGTVGALVVNKRPPGCFVNDVIQTQQCVNHVCIEFNGNADFSKHDQFPETTDFRAICAEAAGTIANADSTQPTKAGNSATTATTKMPTIIKTTSKLAGCEAQGKLSPTTFCPENTYKILSKNSCEESVKRLRLKQVFQVDQAKRNQVPSGCYVLKSSLTPLFNPLDHDNKNIPNKNTYQSICCEKLTTTTPTTTSATIATSPATTSTTASNPAPSNTAITTTTTTKISQIATARAVTIAVTVASPKEAPQFPVIVMVIVIAIFLAVLLIILGVVCYKLCQKTTESSDANKQIAEQENTIATLSSAVATPMMDPNMSTTQAMKIWMANGLMLSSDNITRGKKIGYGGAGQVYHGVWGSVDVALKESYSLTMSGKAKEVINEVSTLTKLNNPKIVRLFGMWYDNAVPSNPKLYMVMEYCARGSLSDHIVRSFDEVSKEQRQSWCIQISEAMAFLHTRDPCIVHRDLKPGNVLLDDNCDCKVADFGLSRDVTSTNRDFTQNIGTIAYMPPEALETSQYLDDEPRECAESSELLGTKWDVYSYAIMYLYILTGQRPYRGLDNRQIMLFVFMKNERPPLPEELLIEEEAVLIQSLWVTDPRRRPTFQDILQRQYAMYRHETDVKILKTPKKKNNMTTRKFQALPALELTPVSKKDQRGQADLSIDQADAYLDMIIESSSPTMFQHKRRQSDMPANLTARSVSSLPNTQPVQLSPARHKASKSADDANCGFNNNAFDFAFLNTEQPPLPPPPVPGNTGNPEVPELPNDEQYDKLIY